MAARKLLGVKDNLRVPKMRWEPVLGGNYVVKMEVLGRFRGNSETCKEELAEEDFPHGKAELCVDGTKSSCSSEFKAGACYRVCNGEGCAEDFSVMVSAVKQANGLMVTQTGFPTNDCKANEATQWQNLPTASHHIPDVKFGQELCVPSSDWVDYSLAPGGGFVKLKIRSEMPLALILILGLSGFIILRELVGLCLWRRRRNQARFRAQSAALNMKMKSTSA